MLNEKVVGNASAKVVLLGDSITLGTGSTGYVIFSKVIDFFGLDYQVLSPHDTAFLFDSSGSMSDIIDKASLLQEIDLRPQWRRFI